MASDVTACKLISGLLRHIRYFDEDVAFIEKLLRAIGLPIKSMHVLLDVTTLPAELGQDDIEIRGALRSQRFPASWFLVLAEKLHHAREIGLHHVAVIAAWHFEVHQLGVERFKRGHHGA